MEKLAKGADPKDVFDYCGGFYEGFARLELSGRWNFLTTDGKILSDTWFDFCGKFENGLAFVLLNGKSCKIDTNGIIR